MKVTIQEAVPERLGLPEGFKGVGTVTLELNAYEAAVIYHLSGRVTGSSEFSPRGICDVLHDKLGNLQSPRFLPTTLRQNGAWFEENVDFMNGWKNELLGS